jgi:hypothetical protein
VPTAGPSAGPPPGDSEPRPRPGRDSGPGGADPAVHRSSAGRPRRRGRGLALPEPPPPGQLAGSTAGAIVSAARVGRLLGRTGLRLARQLPGVSAVETQALRLRQLAVAEMTRLLEVPQQAVGGGAPGAIRISNEERRVMMLLRDAGDDPQPLRTAMGELLHRSAASNSKQGREYLFGTIISQLVPDEARILAALAGGRRFAAIDVLAKVGRSQTRVLLANASTVGAAAHIALPENAGTYVTRLHAVGLVDFSPVTDGLESQFTALNEDPAVRAARSEADGKFGSARIARKSITLSSFGREFWQACAPAEDSRGRLPG